MFNRKKKREFTVDEYHFCKHNNRIVVKSISKKDKEELDLIAKLEMEYYLSTRKGGFIRRGEWQWCLNSDECRNAVYTCICEIEETRGKIFCSHHCRNRILGTKKTRLKKGLKCSACGVIMERIYSNPGRCPICKHDAIFIVAKKTLSPKLRAFYFK